MLRSLMPCCRGTLLPHLLTQDTLVEALRAMAAILRPGGLLVLQDLNYDLRWRVQPRWFAAQGGELAGQEALVWRFADYLPEDERIAFHVGLFRKTPDGWKVAVHTTPQRPLFERDLMAGLKGPVRRSRLTDGWSARGAIRRCALRRPGGDGARTRWRGQKMAAGWKSFHDFMSPQR
jgi:hypothetical protein